jgi:hypothetical protein
MLPFITPLFVKKLSIFKDNYVAFLFVIVLYMGSIHKLNGQIVQIAESNQNNQLSSTKGLIEVSQNNEIKRVDIPIKIDGVLSDSVWKSSKFSGDFWQHFPYDTSKAKVQTQFALCYNDKFLYAAFICENPNPKKPFVVNNLKRDFSVLTNDAIVLTLSPFLDGQNGFSFGVTPYNAQREGAVENGGTFGVTTAWDQVWFSATQLHDNYWIAEMAIPLSSIRFNQSSKNWGVNVARMDFKSNEISTFKRVPRNFNISGLVFVDTVKFHHLPPKRFNGAIIPYISNVTSQLKSSDKPIHQPRFGFDAKIGLTQSLNLDVTVNPDFANVDVDAQQINLTRFSLFFPERRQFFIENSDLFANFGFRQIRPFFSRKIGLTSKGTNIPISYGMRLSGKYGNRLRLGLMNVTTSTDGINAFNPINYSIFAVQRKVLNASNVGFIWVHDQVLNVPNKDYNSVIGTEFNLLTSNNRYSGKAFVQKSIYPGLSFKNGYAHATWFLYKTLDWMLMWNHEYVSKSYSARTGFVPRIDNYDPVSKRIIKMDYWRLEPEIKRTFYPSGKGKINNYSFFIYNSSYYDSSFKLTESITQYAAELYFQNGSYVRGFVHQDYYNLFLPFRPPVALKNGGYFDGKHRWLAGNLSFETNNRKRLSLLGEVDFGGYFIGNKAEYSGTLNWRVKGLGKKRIPRLFIAANFRHIDFYLSDSGNYRIDLIGLKTEYTLSTTSYITGYWQLNAQNKLMNMNLRYQWRYRPMSDLFIVFSQNWDQVMILPNRTNQFDQWMLGGRSLAVKLNFWL